jgi:hypothetical protein
MISCDYDLIQKRFEDSYNAQRAAAGESTDSGESTDAEEGAEDADPTE